MSGAGEFEPEPQAAAEPAPVLNWHPGKILVLAADRSLSSALDRMEKARFIEWVVVVRRDMSGLTYYYAFRPGEVVQLAVRYGHEPDAPLQKALGLHEEASSAKSRGRRAPVPDRWESAGPAAARVVDLDADDGIAGIGEYSATAPATLDTDDGIAGIVVYPAAPVNLGDKDGNGRIDQYIKAHPATPYSNRWTRRVASATLEFRENVGDLLSGLLGSFRSIDSGFAPPSLSVVRPSVNIAPPPPAIAVTISAETEVEINILSSAEVDFRIELTAEALPFAVFREVPTRPDLPIVVLLSVENDLLEVVGLGEITKSPPIAGYPSTGSFVVMGSKVGTARLAVTFRQGGSELGLVGLAVEVVASGAKGRTAKASEAAAPADPGDDDKLALIIEQSVKAGQVRYRYILHSEALNLQYESFESKPLLDRGDGPAPTALAFVERIYGRVTQELKSFDDLQELQREARALGAGLSRELFDPDVARRLWPLRDRITLIQICSWEPYIPWELVRLHNPDTLEIDERFLAEYNLVRTLTDRAPARTLKLAKWRYLAGNFPLGSLPPVGAELDYFTREMQPSLRARGIKAMPIAATRDAFYDAVADGDFDVLHVSCHAESQHASIEDSSLVIGDEAIPGSVRPRLIEVNGVTVAGEANLLKRRPLVFLNACETGRAGAVLTAWGGWPNLFLRAGAGAFVGTAWAVRDKPAAAFCIVFYEALLDGKTLAEAAGEARAAAKALGDASWLAFKVYGHPRARRASP